MPWYERIVSAFGYSVQRDRESALVLHELIAKVVSPLEQLRKLIKGRDIMIFGAGPSLDNNLHSLTSCGLEKSFTLIAADGATTAFVRESVIPQIIVTDLDGNMDDIIKSIKLGSTTVVHAHGDNIDTLRKWVPRIIDNRRRELFGTCQVEPSSPVIYNFGGFTDGDRSAFLAEEMGAKTIILAGMDLGTEIGKYSKKELMNPSQPQGDEKWLSNKRLKLKFARELLEWLATWSRAEGGLLNATGPTGQMIRGFPRIDFKVLAQFAKMAKQEPTRSYNHGYRIKTVSEDEKRNGSRPG
jgi:uncharacterized Rossmann fold enzyme